MVLCVRVTPKSARSRIVGEGDGELKIALHAPPAGGRANAELLRLLSKTFGVPKSRLAILSGEASRSKRILFLGLNPDSLSALESEAG
ncbi:MAG: DUF167 domain-containing protein [bacterium]